MPVIYAPESAYAKEMVKHEAHYSQFGPPQRPYVFRPYPKRLVKVEREAMGGKILITDHRDVDDESAELLAKGQGFLVLAEAADALASGELDVAKLAAEINYDVKHKLSPAAAAEVAVAQANAPGHLAVVPETPIKPRARREE